MGAQDNTEQVLRDIHILLSKGEMYDENRVILDKKVILNLLKRLNGCIYELMEEYEMTQSAKDAAERELRKLRDHIVSDANRKAEDVYAASVLYTDEALYRVQDIMKEAAASMSAVYEKLCADMKQEQDIVRRDQSELKGHLQDLADTKKYLMLIEERNKQLRKEKEEEKDEPKEPSVYAEIKPEIKINAAYFEKMGILLEEQAEKEVQEVNEEDKKVVTPEIKINLDAEYFKWKDSNAGTEEKKEDEKEEKHTIFGKFKK